MRKFFLHIFLAAALSSFGAPIDEAKELYNQGEYQAALTRLEQIVKKTPRDGTANYWLGATYHALGRDNDAIAPLEKAEARGVADASLLLGRIAHDQYRPDDARDYFDNYESLLAKKKKSVPNDVEDERRRAIMMENMLNRVEKIAVIDSLIVDAEDFFKAYRLSPSAGRLISGELVDLPDAEVAFIPQNDTQILYAEPDSLGNFVLMGADILDDGSVDHPAPLPGDNLAGGGNAEYPFMLSDGLTLYYANDGEESLGGYDIFLTRPDDEGNYLQPQNVGMPYNSPYDDYLLAIDESAGIGWWATDRNRIPGKLTIYVFVPTETRVNVSEDDENLVELAKLNNIALTREAGVSYPEIPQAVDPTQLKNSYARDGGSEFILPIGSTTRIYKSMTDFKSADARRAMGEAINARAQVNNIEAQLATLREAYSKGDHSQADLIITLERNLSEAHSEMKNLENKAIRLELDQSR